MGIGRCLPFRELKRAKLNRSDIDRDKINEAFAASI